MKSPNSVVQMGQAPCPCRLVETYANCCQPFHFGTPASNAEQLMRSRYSAYVLRLESYLLSTWHPETRPDTLQLHLEDNQPKWLGLKVIRHDWVPGETRAIVEFIARYRYGGGRAEKLHETSEFLLTDRWYYLNAL